MDPLRNPGHARLVRRQAARASQDAGIAGIVAGAVGNLTSSTTKATATVAGKTTATTAAQSAATTGKAASTGASSSASSSSSTASSTNAALSSTSTSTSHTSTIVAVVVVVLVLLALVGGFFGYRKWKQNRASRGSGTPLVNGNSFANGGFRKQDDDEDEMFGNSPSNHDLMSGGTGSGGEKSYGSNNAGQYGTTGVSQAGMAGMGAGREYQQREQQSQQQYGGQQPYYANNNASDRWEPSSPSALSSPVTYPPPSATSSSGLLQDQSGGQGKRSLEEQHGRASPAAKGLATVDERDAPRESADSPFAESPGQGKVHVVKRTFEPSLEDELIIFPGDRIQVLMSYDDGWALGINLDAPTPGTKGVFPFDCLDDPASAQAEAPNQESLDASNANANSRRDSSYATQDQPSFSQPPQLAPLRSDSPLSNHFPLNSQHPPQSQQQPQPTISISQPSSRSIFDQSQSGSGGMSHSTSVDNVGQLKGNGNGSANGRLDARGNRQGEKNKRASSLIASRDANLFVALGEALGKEEHR